MKYLSKILPIIVIYIVFMPCLQSCKKKYPPDVTTGEVSQITQTSAVSGGNVTNNGGAQVTVRGICWATAFNPTIDSNIGKTTDGTGTGSFTSSITGLTASSEYHVRAYATNSEGIGYGEDVMFNTSCDPPSAPIIGTITNPTCNTATGSVVLNGLPSTGNWTVTTSPGETITSGTGASTTISELAAGETYTFTVTNAAGCVSSASGNVVINEQPAPPSPPEFGTITQPTCSIATGSVVLSSLPSTGTWTLTRSPGGTTTTGSGTSTTVSGLASGTYTFTVTNASGCVSAASGNIVINTKPSAPSVTTGAYSVSVSDVVISGTVNANNASTQVTFEYGTTTGYSSTINASPNTVSGSNTTSVNAMLTGLLPGYRYYFRVSATNNCGTTKAAGNDFTTILTDRNGNIYNTVTIGSQVWMKENLKTTKYRDGTSIPNVTDNSAWSNLTIPGYCWYNNDPTSYKNTYGALYNYYAVSTDMLCPIGWYVPTDNEWTTLINYLGGEAVAGGKLKESGTAHWISPNTGATNESGFSALPAGTRYIVDGTFNFIGYNAVFWTTSFNYTRSLFHDRSDVFRGSFSNRWYGFSVRCIKD